MCAALTLMPWRGSQGELLSGIFYIMKTGIFQARLAVLSCALSAAFPALAQNQSTTMLKEVVVTATRSETLANDLISDVTVISRQDIDSGVGRTVGELLARVAGVKVASNGGLGKNSSVFIRGTETIALEVIERIEVLKGPASALYGSDAVGGVIQIFTRKGSAGFHPYASLTVGENDRAEVAAGLNGGTAELNYAFGVQNLNEKGFSATNPRVSFNGFNADRDGLSQNSAYASASWKVTDGWKLDGRALQSTGTSQFDNGASTFDARGEFETQVFGLGLQGRLSAIWKSRISLSSSTEKSSSFTSAVPSLFNTKQDQWTWQNDVTTPVGVVVAGFDNLKETVSGTTAYTVDSRTTESVFAGLNGQAGAHSWQLNARQDHNSQFGDATTGLVGYGFKITPDLRAHASYGTSFKMPSFNTLYFPLTNGFQGNPTTQPERTPKLGSPTQWVHISSA